MNDLDAMIEKVVDELTQKDSDDAPSCNWCWVCPDCRTRVVQQIVGNGASRVGAGPNLGPIHSELAALIDHTLLKPDATEEQITKLCEEAAQCGFASVCVNPCWVRLCRDLLRGSKVKVCTVIGFPLGATTCESKAFETQTAIDELLNQAGGEYKNWVDVLVSADQSIQDAATSKKEGRLQNYGQVNALWSCLLQAPVTC